MESENPTATGKENSTETAGATRPAVSLKDHPPYVKDQPKLYPFDQHFLSRKINLTPKADEPSWATFEFEHPAVSHPPRALEDQRERAMQLSTYKGVAKIQGKDTLKHAVDDDPANTAFFDHLFRTVESKEYYLKGDAPSEPVTLSSTDVVELDYTDPDVLAEYPPKKNDEPYYVRDLISVGHKSTAVYTLITSDFKVIPAHYRLGASRKWKVIQSGPALGGYEIEWVFKEPKESARKKFRNSAFSSLAVQGLSAQNQDRIPMRITNANIPVMYEIVRDTIHHIEGASINGLPFDVQRDDHWHWVLGNYCKDALAALFEFLEADAGN